jgi:hypothetical protein
VITGAFFFVRSLLQFVNGEAPFAGDANGWTLTAFFFFDAWLLGECQPGPGRLLDLHCNSAALLQQPAQLIADTVAGIMHTFCACQAACAALLHCCSQLVTSTA